LLRTWAQLGRELVAARRQPVPDWGAACKLVAAARKKLALDAKALERLLAESRKRLHPLEDPFDLDLGMHRWLDGEREEAYSD
jgi:hypothetical protein